MVSCLFFFSRRNLLLSFSLYLWIDVFLNPFRCFYVVRHKCRTFYQKRCVCSRKNKKRTTFLDVCQESLSLCICNEILICQYVILKPGRMIFSSYAGQGISKEESP